MAVPDYQSLMLPLLRKIEQRGGETFISELIDEIAGELKLSESDTSLLVPSGRQTVLSNRLHWAKTYLQRAGLVESTRHGYFKITNRGRELLGENPAKIDNRMLSRFPEFVEWKSRSRVVEEVVGEASLETIGSPDDQITANVERLTKELSDDLISRVHSFPAGFFERLVMDLLIAMGYGGGRAEMARALGRSGDGGVDGVVKMAVLMES